MIKQHPAVFRAGSPTTTAHPVPAPRRRPPALALAALAALAAFYLYRNVYLALGAVAALPSDFDNYYAAARSLAGGGSPYVVANFDYPPLVAFALLPFALFDYEVARRLWFALGHVCLLSAGVGTWRLAGGGWPALLATAAVWTLGGTVVENLVVGQVTPVLLALVVAAAGWAVHRRLGASAIAVAAAAALKIFPGVLLAAFALGRHRRPLLAGAGLALLLFALPWAALTALPPPRAPASAGYWMGTPALLNFSLPAVALRLADPPREGTMPRSWREGNDPRRLRLPPGRAALSLAVSLLTLAAGAALLARRLPLPLPPPAWPLAFAALLTLALLASPIAWYHYQLLQLPGIALLASRWGRRPGARWRLPALALLLGGLTWAHAFGVGAYTAAWGWTAAQPALLWGATCLVPALGTGLFALYLAELRHL